ncbi:MAG: undecaprenyldiphospho-muramoylpentapeptide beta-N-acetylglucosaminyltransferase [Chitinispirillales bacterium]|jgi:UDP-N-acetylglucosamine--N-acetylmuramyl-(pentapeptide) pyrophosphoryl-undecaprenol N-acetylglucosamine transferase|nr:undecaprenyldiphospho-muramoylpentapeptide beta-N-acetylglucosaminyltransferase [Chitinispirillales bacterium]
MKKILLTGGGTAGHVTPNIALMPGLKKMGLDVHYVGTRNGMERGLVEKTGVPYHCVSAGKLRRYFDFKNFTDLFRIALGFFQSLVLMIRLRPAAVFSKGGFVSCPVVWAAWACGVPAIVHESDITPGLANKLSIPFAKKICFSFPETEAHLPPKKRVITGLPVREGLFAGDAGRGREYCGFAGDEKPVIVVIGGSLGAQAVNEAVRSALDRLLDDFNICHICGKGGKAPGARPGYCQLEYVNEELPDIFAMADTVISRAGATTLFELLALKKPMLLIPLGTAASRGDQILNAQSFEKSGYCKALPQDGLTGEVLAENVREVYNRRDSYVDAMGKAEAVGGVERVLEVLSALHRFRAIS